MSCLTLTVFECTPTATKKSGTLSFAEGVNCTALDTDCIIEIDDLPPSPNNYVTIIVTITVTGCAANFKLKFDYKKDTVAKTYTTTLYTDIPLGDNNMCVSMSDVWALGDYTDLAVTVQDLAKA